MWHCLVTTKKKKGQCDDQSISGKENLDTWKQKNGTKFIVNARYSLWSDLKYRKM